LIRIRRKTFVKSHVHYWYCCCWNQIS